MPEAVDPFTSLERPIEPIAPSRAFVAELRGRIERALGRSHGPVARSVLIPYLAVRDAGPPRASTRTCSAPSSRASRS